MFLLSSAAFFQNQLSQKILSGTPSECQTFWTQIRTNRMLVLIWVQTVCDGYQQMTKVAACRERVNMTIAYWNVNTIILFDPISISSFEKSVDPDQQLASDEHCFHPNNEFLSITKI